MTLTSHTSLVAVWLGSLALIGCSDNQPGAGPGSNAPGGSLSSGGSAPGTPVAGNASAAGSPAAGGAGTGGSAGGVGGGGPLPHPMIGDIAPLYGEATELEPEVLYDRGDAIVTQFGDRGRDRHAKEDQFQSYDHWLAHYWEHRTGRFIFVDKVTKGVPEIEVSWVQEWELDNLPEFRAWYSGRGSVAQYYGNYSNLFVPNKEGPATFDHDHVKISDEGHQFKYTATIKEHIALDGTIGQLAVGQFMEIEISQFLKDPPVGRDNYYGTTYLYEVGNGGLVPWYTVGTFEDQSSEREDSRPLDRRGWLGGYTTLPYNYTDEPDNHFIQMATNLSGFNAQPFVRGRRVHHTNFVDGSHDENPDNETFTELVGLAGPNFVNHSCDSCHKRNGRAPVAPNGEALDKWVFKIAAADGSKDPARGGVLQPSTLSGGVSSEGTVSIAEWVENEEGLRAPKYAFSAGAPALFSARIAPQLVGMGLLEAIDELTILEMQDINDVNGDGISGKAQISIDPVTGWKRLGRFGWKAGQGSLNHQIAGALNTDMGIMTSIYPSADCGASQQGCADEGGVELSDAHFTDLVKYVSLLGIRARRDLDSAETKRGEELFGQIGCATCHRPEVKTGAHHPLAELRNQTIHPYSDLLLHDMGPGLADNLGEGEATGAEWRTTPLWGLGLSACVTGGVVGPFQQQVCEPHESYLHDGRARSIDEAIRWHGGEGQASKDAYVALSAADNAALLAFLKSL